MRLSLIAMSGSGKSYWSAKLAKDGFRRFDCDRMIAAKLGPALTPSDGRTLSLGDRKSGWQTADFLDAIKMCL